MSSQNSTVLGVALLIRHGDRQGFYQSETSYTPSLTAITPLGNKQEYDLGSQLRTLYLDPTSPSYIHNISTGLFNQGQVSVRADAGGEGGVIYDSAISLVAGLWPATTAYNTTLANGTTVVAPLGGYQVVPVTSVDPNLDVSLEGFTACPSFTKSTSALYNSTFFQAKTIESQAFLNNLHQYLDGRPVNLQNMWNIFDFMNVQSIHNATFARNLPPTFLQQARTLADWHEYYVFSSPDPQGPGTIAGRTVIPSLLNAITTFANASSTLKLSYQAISYKPFISLFNLTNAAAQNPELAGVVNYAAALALEVRQSPNGPVVRMNFKNGTDDQFKTYNFFNTTGDVPIDTFTSFLAPLGVNTTADWCNACANVQDRGCPAALALAQVQSGAFSTSGGRYSGPISPIGAGFLGAGLALVVVAAMFAVLAFIGVLTLGKRGRKQREMAEK